MACRRRIVAILIGLTGSAFNMAAQSMNNLLATILQNRHDSLLRSVLADPDRYRYQVIYTEINRDQNNLPNFVWHELNVDDDLYFYPASVVKLPAALLALEKINKLKVAGFSLHSTIMFDSAQRWQAAMTKDPSAYLGKPSIGHFIREALLVSENEAYNRLYQFIGQQEFNRGLHEKGFEKSRITRQFLRISPEENRYANPYRIFNEKGSEIFHEPERINTDSFNFSKKFQLGNAHYDWNDSLINSPLDFSMHNYLPLRELNEILTTTVFPSSAKPSQRFDLSQQQELFILQYLSQFPGETNYPKYDSTQYYDTYVKFFFKGPNRAMPKDVRVFNKVGWAYGCLTDVSYVVDFKNKVEFMLAATVYVNENDILNDNNYEYEEIGLPFLYQLGQAVYEYELSRKRAYEPDLSQFRMQYETRVDDDRPMVGEVDN